MRIKKDTCIAFTFAEGRTKCYFNTGKTRKVDNKVYHIFCEILPEEELHSINNFWCISNEYFNKQLASGRLRIIEKFKDLEIAQDIVEETI